MTQTKSPKKTFKSITTNFFESTALHGLPHIAARNHCLLKLLWFLIFVIGLVVLGLHVQTQLGKYYSYPTQTMVSLKPAEQLIFPAVTVCNLNPLKKSLLMCTDLEGVILLDIMATDAVYNRYQQQAEMDENDNPYLELSNEMPWNCTELKLEKKKQVEKLWREREDHSEEEELDIGTTTDGPTEDTITGVSTDAGLTDHTESDVGITDELMEDHTEDHELTTTAVTTPVAMKRKKRDITSDPSLESDKKAVSNRSKRQRHKRNTECDPDFDYLLCQMYQNETEHIDESNLNHEDYYDWIYDDEDSHEDDEYDEEYEENHFGTDQSAAGKISLAELKNTSNVYQLLLSYRTTSDLSDLSDIVNFNQQQVKWFGYKAKDFILECSFDKANCSSEMFAVQYNKKYGNCFTFNSGLNLSSTGAATVYNTRKYGSQYGLRLTLNLNSSEYVGLLAPEYGARVLIHPPKTTPYPDMDGYDATPGMLTGFGLTNMQVKRLQAPYESNCMNQYPDLFKELVKTKGDFPYDMRTCQQACIDHYLLQNCNCTDSEPFKNQTMSRERCSSLKTKERKCKIKILKQFTELNSKKSISCGCMPPCQETKYRRAISQSQWPTWQYKNMRINNFYGLNDTLSHIFGKEESKEESFQFIQENLVRLQVFYQELNYELMEETPAYGLEDLLADIGGIIGLYVGLSVCAMFEVLFFVIHITYHFFKIGFCTWGDEKPTKQSHKPSTPAKPKSVSFHESNPTQLYDDIGPPGSYYH